MGGLAHIPILSIVIFFPMVGVLFLLLIDRENESAIKGTALAFSLIEFVLSLPLMVYFNSGTAKFQFVEKIPWVKSLGIQYFLGLDGISLLLVMLTTFLTVLCILSSWRAITKYVKEYMISMLFLETGMLGAFLALDLVLFYIFWEMMLIPMYLLIGVWGGPRRIYAAVKFFLYTMVGSVLMMVAIMALYFLYHRATGVYTFDITKLYQLNLPLGPQMWMFAAFSLAFAIKVPMFPFHTWLPDAHTEAPTAGSVILAGVLLKMGTYGFIRFSIPLFPSAAHKFVPLIMVLAVIGIIYGALVAMMQKDVKKLVAYSSVSHLGFVMLGMFALNIQSVEGSIYQMLNHGISTGALFLIVGMIYERRHTRLIKDFGGLSKQLPIYATFFMIVTLSSIGLPGTNGFVGEFLILLGTFKSSRIFAVFAATGVVLGAAYMLWMFQRVMFGKLDKEENKVLKDLNFREIITLVPLVILIFWMGVYPSYFIGKMQKSVTHFLTQVNVKVVARQELDQQGRAMATVVWQNQRIRIAGIKKTSM